MKLIKKETFDRIIKKDFTYYFSIEKKGLYAIEVSARAKSWFQNILKLKSFFKDDDLTAEIDGIEFKKLSGKGGIFDSETAWNGNQLKNLRQINLFLIYFTSGGHSIKFFADQSPFLESIKIYEIENSEFNLVPNGEYKIESGNRRPWLKLISVNLELKNILVEAKALGKNNDDQDLQFRLDGKRELNTIPKAHKYWFWCGRVSNGESRILEKELNLETSIHYLEFWADNSPTLSKLRLGIKRTPTSEDPFWTGNFREDPNDILLARLIFGEARNQPEEAKIWVAATVLNRVRADAWPDNIKDVILEEGQFDPFKKNDDNFDNIIDPLKIEFERLAWYESYGIAKDIISGNIKNPTRATHFHGTGIMQEKFMRQVVPQGEFLKQIGDIYFYWSPN